MGKRDRFMFKADRILSCTSNIISDIIFKIDNTKRSVLKRNEKLLLSSSDKDVCFVLGNGPSSNIDNLRKIKGYDSISVNFFHKGAGDIRTKYHLMVDPGFATIIDYSEYARNLIQNEKDTIFIINSVTGQYYYGNNCESYPTNVYCIDDGLIQYGDNLHINMCCPMTSSPNVIPTAIECVLYMGYKRIFLLGCEFGLYGNPCEAGGHFYEEQKQRKQREHDSPENLMRCALVHMHHEAIVKYCDKNNVIIRNLTPLSNLGEYDSDDLDNILEELNKPEQKLGYH